ncbi:hypothetical protein [Saccharothrix sp.]|uniref:hypothetical protein n=1 Tax=Saccharothrix sp. TaxID=1873460 RepID=UPI00281104E9|nr:hypothetical protein [Saccharothrix sp.]
MVFPEAFTGGHPKGVTFGATVGQRQFSSPIVGCCRPTWPLVIARSDGQPRSRATAVGRALLATAALALGFLVVFGAFGLVVAPLAASTQQYLPAITVVIGAALV